MITADSRTCPFQIQATYNKKRIKKLQKGVYKRMAMYSPAVLFVIWGLAACADHGTFYTDASSRESSPQLSNRVDKLESLLFQYQGLLRQQNAKLSRQESLLLRQAELMQQH